MSAFFADCAYGHYSKPLTQQVEHAIISLNYDTIIDEAIAETGRFVPDYKIGQTTARHPLQTPVSLLKLHGSLNWTHCAECDSEANEISVGEAAECPKCRNRRDVVIVPPSWDKGSYKGVIQKVWAAAFDDLRHSQQWVFIGVSLPATDSYLRFLLGLAISENMSLRSIILVHPGEGLSFQDLASRLPKRIAFTHIRQTFRKALCHDAGDGFLFNHLGMEFSSIGLS